MNPTVSVIVPCYNAGAYLTQCLDSLCNQTYRFFEALIVDDGSSDDTRSIAESYAKRDSRFSILHQDNHGVSSARNLALKKAKGDYLMFVDSDDWIEDNAIERLLYTATANNVEIVVCEYTCFDDSGRDEVVKLREYHGMTFPEAVSDVETKYLGVAWNKLIRRELVVRPFHEEFYYYENLIFLLENCGEGVTYALLHEPIYHYREHVASATHALSYDERKLTSLDAASYAMRIVPERLVAFYEYAYLKRLCWLSCCARADGVKLNLRKERRQSRGYLAHILTNKDVPPVTKVKATVFRLFPGGYYLYLRLKQSRA